MNRHFPACLDQVCWNLIGSVPSSLFHFFNSSLNIKELGSSNISSTLCYC